MHFSQVLGIYVEATRHQTPKLETKHTKPNHQFNIITTSLSIYCFMSQYKIDSYPGIDDPRIHLWIYILRVT